MGKNCMHETFPTDKSASPKTLKLDVDNIMQMSMTPREIKEHDFEKRQLGSMRENSAMMNKTSMTGSDKRNANVSKSVSFRPNKEVMDSLKNFN